MALFSKEELEELRKADKEIYESFVQTQEERVASRKRDRDALMSALDNKARKIAENQRAYYEANREKYNAYMREYQKKKRLLKKAEAV